MPVPELFEKYVLNNNVEVPSRLVAAPLTLFCSDPKIAISDEERDFLGTRGKNYGLYILGACAVSREGIAFNNQPISFTEEDIPALVEKAKVIKANDPKVKIINQIHHGGIIGLKQFSGLQPVGPSADIVNQRLKEEGKLTEDTKIRELTNEEIENLIQCFAKAAELSLKAGHDGIEIHGANNYLIQQFYSRHTNNRNDGWGGSNANRMKFGLRIIDEICKVRDKYNRPDFIIGYRLSPEEPFEEGITMTDTLELVRELVKKPIQYIHVSQINIFQSARRGEGAGTERLKLIYKETKGKMALIGCGGLLNENHFKSAIEKDFCEFYAVGKANMLNKDLGVLLQNGGEVDEAYDSSHPEKYLVPKFLWNLSLNSSGWLPSFKQNNSN